MQAVLLKCIFKRALQQQQPTTITSPGLGSIPIFEFQFQFRLPLKSSIPIPVHIKKFDSNSIPIHLNSIPIQFQLRLQILKFHIDLAITGPLAATHY